MGKTKNRKFRKKGDPVGLPSVKSVELEDDETGGGSSRSNTQSKNEHIIQTILEQLETPGVDGKLFGLTTLAKLADDQEFVEDSIKHNIIRITGPLLVDPSLPIRNAAAVALRNLSGMGMPEICDLLVEEDVLTCVFTMLNKYYSSNWLSISENGESMVIDDQSRKKSSKRSRKISKSNSDSVATLGEDLLTNTFTQAVHILWNLCKSSDLAVKFFNQQNILPLLARCLDPKECGIEPAVAVAHCLNTVTEDNEVAALELRQTSEDVLLKILSPAFEGERSNSGKPSKFLLLRVLAAGIVMNITKGSSDLTPVLNTRLGQAISDAISEDHLVALGSISKILVKEGQAIPSCPTESDSMDEGENTLDFHVEEIESLIAAQTIAVELLTNLYFKEDEDDDWVDSDCEDMSVSEPMNNRVMNTDGLPEMVEAFGGKSHVDNLVKKIEKNDAIWKELEKHPDAKNIISRFNTLRCRSLLCLHNVITSLQDEDLGGFTGFFPLMDKLGNLVFKEGSKDAALLEAASAAMRAVAERLKRMNPVDFANKVTASGLQMLFDAENQCIDPTTKANLIRTVGVMGEALSLQDETSSLLEEVGTFLLQVSTRRDEELWVVAEALDALMDVFAEDSTDAAAVNIGLVDSLRSILPGLRAKLRQQRKTLGHHAAIIATANTNLERFVKYKTKHICNGASNVVCQ